MKTWITYLAAAVLPLGLALTAVAQDDGNMDGPATPEATPAPEKNADKKANKKANKKAGKKVRQQERRFRRGMMDVDRLTEQLGLNPEQAEQLKGINGQIREKMAEIRKSFQDGSFDPSKMREGFQGMRKEFENKVNAILNTEQQAKMKEIRKKQRSRMGGMRGDRGRRTEELGKRLRAEALKALELDEEATALVTPRLDSVLETRKLILAETARRRDEFRKKIREVTEPAEIETLLKNYREAKQAEQAQLKSSQDQLRELLTLSQEAKLVALNLLD